MKVTIVGTGNMARGIATRVLAGGHHVAFVGTALGKAEELADEFEGEGNIGASEDADGDVVVLAVSYTEAPHAVRQHVGELAGAVLVDVTNPVSPATTRARAGSSRSWSVTAVCGRSRPGPSPAPASSRPSACCTWSSRRRSAPTADRPSRS